MNIIRKINPGDWNQIAMIQDLCYPAEAREEIETLQCHWREAPDFCFVAAESNHVIAYLLAHPWKKRVQPPVNSHYSLAGLVPDSVFIHDIALHQNARGKGLAGLLVAKLFDVAAKNGYCHFSLISVQGTAGFWQRLGFDVCTTFPVDFFSNIKNHYPGGGYFYMEKQLK